jgi:(R,R)-butanediol dehydrogenase/meso-butanediol dehydrogenase/diacetyl reductase
MRAAIVESASRPLAVREVPDPQPGPGELILRVRSAGICGTDLHLAGEPLVVQPGTILGHEFAGEVAAVGAGVDDWRVGERACALPVIGCGRCAACGAGDSMGCAGVRLLGAGDLPGAFAEYVRVGARESFRLPEGVDDDAGALVEPFAFGLHAVRAAALEPGDGVLVVGGGTVGLAIAAWSHLLGAADVVVAERLAHRRALASALGATAVDATDAAAMGGVADLLGGAPRVVFECVGRPGMLAACVDHVARRGRVVVAGACMELDTVLPAIACLKEADLRFVVSYAHRDFALALRMVGAGRLPATRLITGHVSLDELPDAFVALRTPAAQCKTMLRP